MKAKSKITRLTIARLYNTGNYEHVRYEITTEVPKGASAKQAMLDTARILAALTPVKRPYNLESMQASLAKSENEQSEFEKDKRVEWTKQIAAYHAAVANRNRALDQLDAIGGVSKRGDAKDKWDDDDLPF